MEIERNELQQLVVSHLGQQHLATAFEQILGQLALGVNELIDLFFNRPAADELVHEHVPGLADAERTVGGLILDGWIPPAIEMHDMRSGSEVESGAAGLQRDDEERHALVLLELPDQRLSLADRRLAVQNEARAAEERSKKRSKRCSHLSELREDEHFLL